MRLAFRFVLVLLLGTLFTAGIAAQDSPAAPETVTAGTPPASSTAPEPLAETASPESAVATTSSHEIRERFAEILRNQPRELGTILALDPTLLSNDAFLAGYPALAAFVTEHPQVRRNPRFYLQEYSYRESSVEKIVHLP